MLQTAIVISLQIAAIYLLFNKSPIGKPVMTAGANLFDRLGRKTSRLIQAPLWDCFICMSSVWTIVLSWSVDPLLMLTVCGVNYFIAKILDIDAEDA